MMLSNTKDAARRDIQIPARVLGFTLIELMITVVIVGIIAAIAFPSYQRQVQQTRRADGTATLMETAQRLERCFTRVNSYADTTRCQTADDLGSGTIPSPDGWYLISAPTLTVTAFTLEAAPQGAQTADTRCGTLRLTHTGVRDSKDGTAPATCW